MTKQALESLAEDPDRRATLVGCNPTGADDEACMRQFVGKFGRRALRRPLRAEEVDAYVLGSANYAGAIPDAIESGDFYVGVDTAIRTLLQDPEFLYRVEIGTPVPDHPGVFELSQFEVATRMSYFIWGVGPDDDLLDAAEAGTLADESSIRSKAQAMVEQPRARQRIDRYHALWLGYATPFQGGEIGAGLQAESAAAVEHVVFNEEEPWRRIFELEGTYINDQLAEYYGLPAPGADTPTWVDYGESGRRGVLSHGSVLSIGAEANGDTNVTRRGKEIRWRFFCQDVAKPVMPPPPLPPPTGEAICKADRLAVHAEGGCAGCHRQMDPVGFGLENYDGGGRFRQYEPDNPDTPADESQCFISGDGDLDGVQFNGPAGLAEVIVAREGGPEPCMAEHLYRFVTGRTWLDDHDREFISPLIDTEAPGELELKELVVDIVADDAFRYRREEEV